MRCCARSRSAFSLDGVREKLEALRPLAEEHGLPFVAFPSTDKAAHFRFVIDELAKAQKALRKAYDTVTKKHGLLNSKANRAAFFGDPQANNLLALETLETTASYVTDKNGNPVMLKTKSRYNINLMARYQFTLAERDAIPGRVQQAIERAAKLLEPKVQTVSLERSTLRSEQEVDAWLGRQKSRLLEGLKQGPVLVN